MKMELNRNEDYNILRYTFTTCETPAACFSDRRKVMLSSGKSYRKIPKKRKESQVYIG